MKCPAILGYFDMPGYLKPEGIPSTMDRTCDAKKAEFSMNGRAGHVS
jgi:hypothetical protein